jgi:uncharacterized phage protein (TIGR01671 family)
MRDIKFRGMDSNGRMNYGYLVPDYPYSTAYYKTHSQRICWYETNGAHANIPVINGSVGQFTGFLDANEKEIYEGDILYFEGYETASNNKVVEFQDGGFIVKMLRSGVVAYLTHAISSQNIVIGNIHQNPELLEAKQ